MTSNGDFPGSSDGKASAYNAGELGSIPELGRSPGAGNGNPLQYSCLENPMDRGVWRATVHGVTESDTTEQLNTAQHSAFCFRSLEWKLSLTSFVKSKQKSPAFYLVILA